MIVVGLDLETTGLDTVKDRPIEVGLTLWTTNKNRSLETHNFLVQSDGVTVPESATEVHGVTQKMADSGWDPQDAFEEVISFVDRAEAIVAFNGLHFDIPMMHQWAKRLGKTFPDKLIIDPQYDLPKTNAAASPGMRPQELITMCAKQGIYFDAHEAGGDVTGMLKLLATRNLNFVLQRAQSEEVVIQSTQSRNENDKAKKHKFRWNPDKGIWWKAVKRIDLDWLSARVNNEFGLMETDLLPEDMETVEYQG